MHDLEIVDEGVETARKVGNQPLLGFQGFGHDLELGDDGEGGWNPSSPMPRDILPPAIPGFLNGK